MIPYDTMMEGKLTSSNGERDTVVGLVFLSNKKDVAESAIYGTRREKKEKKKD